MDKIKQLINEYENFKEEMIMRSTSNEVYEEYYKIHFCEELMNVLNCLNTLPNECKLKEKFVRNIGDLNLDGLFYEFLNLENPKLGINRLYRRFYIFFKKGELKWIT